MEGLIHIRGLRKALLFPDMVIGELPRFPVKLNILRFLSKHRLRNPIPIE